MFRVRESDVGFQFPRIKACNSPTWLFAYVAGRLLPIPTNIFTHKHKHTHKHTHTPNTNTTLRTWTYEWGHRHNTDIRSYPTHGIMDLMLVAFRRGVAGSLLGGVFGDKFEPPEAAAKTTPGLKNIPNMCVFCETVSFAIGSQIRDLGAKLPSF